MIKNQIKLNYIFASSKIIEYLCSSFVTSQIIKKMKTAIERVLRPLRRGSITAKWNCASVMAHVNNSESVVNNQCSYVKLK